VEPSFVLVGDSHAGALAPALFERARELNVSGYQLTETGWCPLLQYEKWGEREKYRFMNHRFEEMFSRLSGLRKLLIVCYWDQAIVQNSYYSPTADRVSGETASRSGLQRISDEYPQIDIIILQTPPESRLFGYHAAARRRLFHRNVPSEIQKEEYIWFRERYDHVLRALAENRNVSIEDPLPVMCGEATCLGESSDGILYRDDDHVSFNGARRLVRFLARFWGAQERPSARGYEWREIDAGELPAGRAQKAVSVAPDIAHEDPPHRERHP
jgi:hypothetical protein